jgi:hypothetical protein
MPLTFKTNKGYKVRQRVWRKNALLSLAESSDLALVPWRRRHEHAEPLFVRADIACERQVMTEAAQHAKLGVRPARLDHHGGDYRRQENPRQERQRNAAACPSKV